MATNEAQGRLPSQEKLLLDYVHRLEKHAKGRRAVHIHLSKLRPFNRRDQHIRAASNGFEPMVKNLDGQLFGLKNGDLFFIYKSEIQPRVETTVQRARFLFSDDPLFDDEEEGAKAFSTWWDAESQFDAILRAVQLLANSEEKRRTAARKRMDARAAIKSKQEKGEPLTPEILDRLETALARADLSNLVRRQFICAVTPKMVPEQFFSELFISIRDLRETLLPGVNLGSNRWLFQHLTETLDRRMLSMLSKTDRITISGDISFNLNVATILSQEFLAFDDNVSASRRGSMVIELQKVDIFCDLGAYNFAREYLQEKGYKICIDGLTHDIMEIIDRERLGADLAKLIWHPDMIDGGPELHEKIRAMVKRAGADRVIMIRCDSREAIDFGRSIGIGLFQGRFVENLIAEDNRRRDLMKLKRRMERN